MKLFRMTLMTALRALRRNKLRSALTMLGIIIGVAAVITMVSIGEGAAAAVQAEIRSLGKNLLVVVPGATTSSGVRSSSGGISSLRTSDAVAIEKECPSDECRYLVDFVKSSKRGIASGSHEQFQTLNAHYTKGKGALRRGTEAAPADDEDEPSPDEIL